MMENKPKKCYNPKPMAPVKKVAAQPADIIIEIGCEELPASYIEPAAAEFAAKIVALLDEKNVPHGEVAYYHTPRRLAVTVCGVAPKADDKIEEYTGPAVAAGRAEDGSFKPPAIGFARKLGLPPEKLSVKKLAKGEYFAAEIKIPGDKTEKILSDGLQGIISTIKFPKSMVWNETKFRFARPIRNILALYGSKIVKFSAGGVQSSAKTFGPGPGFGKKLTVSGTAKYLQALKNTCVLADHREREKLLRRALEAAAMSVKARVLFDEDLVSEVNSLVEYPTALAGRFDKKYLALPEEILITCMKKKQKFFALRTKEGALSENFVAVKNGISSGVERIVAGYEKVLTARLEDALFFYKNDLKLSPDAMAAKLSGVTFRERLGSMADKTARVRKLAVSFADAAGLKEDAKKNAARGAELAKADLTSEIIFEYPELCGIAGAIYAKNAGENDTVVSIIREHYRPSAADSDGTVPSGAEASIVAIADRADTIAADFAIGIIPTGSEDPYGLRRAAAGLLKILLEKNISLPLNLIFAEALRGLADGGDERTKKTISSDIDGTLAKIKDFIRLRLETIFQESGRGIDEIRAALAAGFDDVPDAAARAEALGAAKNDKAFEQITVSLKRAGNIIRQAQKAGTDVKTLAVDETLFAQDEEKELSGAVESLLNDFEILRKSRNYPEALTLLTKLAVPLENFFNKVMVMAPEANLRGNRLALLSRIVERYRLIADFSELKGA